MIRGYMAQSADGYVADEAGSVAFLDDFKGAETGFADFFAEIDTVVMGRKTYDQIVSFGVEWPYAGKHGIVVSSFPLTTVLGDVEPWSGGLDSLIKRLEENKKGDCWVVGGPCLQAAFIENGWMQRLQLFIVPVLLGAGIELFPSEAGAIRMQVASVNTLADGIVELDYRMAYGQ
ncbi:MAG: dihydrofolate reductase family protein [Pseudomonadota bacterium]